VSTNLKDFMRLLFLVIWMIVLPLESMSQVNLLATPKAEKSWWFVVAPGVSRSLSRRESYYLGSYPNLRFRQPFVFAYKLEAGKDATGPRGVTFSYGCGFWSFGYIGYYVFDRNAATGTMISDRMDFRFVQAMARIGKRYTVKTFSIMPSFGITANVLLRARYTYKDENTSGSQICTNQLTRLTLGWEVGSRFVYYVSERTHFQVVPALNIVRREHTQQNFSLLLALRPSYSFTVGFGIVRRMT
jgi:hypothetical protein